MTCVLFSCQNNDEVKKTNDQKEERNKITTVEVVNPTYNSFSGDILISGIAMPNQKVKLFAMENGLVKSINKEIGDQVKKGQTLAQLYNPELYDLKNKAQAEIKKAEARLEKTKTQKRIRAVTEKTKTDFYNRLNGIYKSTPSLTTIMELEQAKGNADEAAIEFQAAEADIKTAESNLAYEKILLAGVETRIGNLAVRAPFSGIISNRYIDNGALVQNGLSNSNPKAIFTIVDGDPIRLTMPFPEVDAQLIKKGMLANIVFPELNGPAISAKISRVAGVLDSESKTMQAEIDIPNPEGKIKPGMYAKINIEVNSRKEVLSLPTQAQFIDKDDFFILTVENEIVKRIPLRKGLSNKSYFELLNQDISPETKVIVKGKNLVSAGQKVRAIQK